MKLPGLSQGRGKEALICTEEEKQEQEEQEEEEGKKGRKGRNGSTRREERKNEKETKGKIEKKTRTNSILFNHFKVSSVQTVAHPYCVPHGFFRSSILSNKEGKNIKDKRQEKTRRDKKRQKKKKKKKKTRKAKKKEIFTDCSLALQLRNTQIARMGFDLARNAAPQLV